VHEVVRVLADQIEVGDEKHPATGSEVPQQQRHLDGRSPDLDAVGDLDRQSHQWCWDEIDRLFGKVPAPSGVVWSHTLTDRGTASVKIVSDAGAP